MNQSKTHLMTVEVLLKNIARQFYETDIAFSHGTDNAVDEAAYLIFGYLKLDHDSPEAIYQRIVAKNDIKAIKS